MAWSSGIFTRLYNFVDDAANGIKILASKQDAEWSNVVGGLNNVICRDGQTPPTADINWGGKKITNLATGVAASDAATVGQIPAATNEYILETNTISYVSPTSFRITATDQTFRYHAGRRVLFVLGGLNYRISTVLSSATVGPDTIVTITPDNTPLDATLMQIWWGLLSYSYPGPSYLSPNSAVSSYARGGGPYPGPALLNYELPTVDLLGELAGTGVHSFTPHYSGVYRMTGSFVAGVGIAASNTVFGVYWVLNGVSQSPYLASGNVPGTAPVGTVLYTPFSLLVSLTAGDVVTFAGFLNPASWTLYTNTHIEITRLR